MGQTQYQLMGAVAVITLNNPSVNGLSLDLRTSILAGVEQAQADPIVKAIVLTGAGKGFSGGADIREFNTPHATAKPTLRALISAIEDSKKPVIAAIGGFCMGGGLELALGCHYRLAAPGTQIAQPEVKLGLLPGAGGTQRLPRAIGVEAALNMIVSGDPIPSEQLQGTALFDEIVAGDLLVGALAFADKVVAEGLPLKRLSEVKIDDSNAAGYFQAAQNDIAARSKGWPAPLKCMEAVEAAVSKPFDVGLQIEGELFAYLMETPESKALRHAFFAERAASKIPDIAADTAARPIRKVGVIGAGTMGSGISMNFLNAGIPVTLLEISQEALDKGVATVRKNYERSLKRGRLTSEQLEQRLGLLKPTLSYGDLQDADLVIEAVFEELGVKEGVFRQLDQAAKPGAILATNTSTLDVNKIAASTRRPEDVIGTHFFSPANVMRLLEVVRAEKTADDVLVTVMQLAKAIKKTAVVSGVCDGFIGNRMLEPYSQQALLLLEEGALPQQVDLALEKFGFAMGIFRVGDLAGNDIGWAIRKRRYLERPDLQYSRIADRLCEKGRFGQKTGMGWYRYEAGRHKAIPDPAVEKLIEAYRREIGIKARHIDDQEIIERCVFALVNEGARILEEGIALRASDIDLVYLNGYGFPAQRGGPLFYADTLGLDHVAQAMGRFALNPHANPGFWTPSAMLLKLAEEGKKFND
jgi:3-hydroxyacyl-CoA dehydrogenase